MKRILYTLLLLIPVLSYGQSSKCESINTKVDKFTKEYRLSTRHGNTAILFAFVDSTLKSTYHLRLTAPAAVNANQKGVSVLFDDGSKMEWPDEKVEIFVNESREPFDSFTQAKCFVPLTLAQMSKLGKQAITDYRLYVYDWSMSTENATSLLQDTRCVVNGIVDFMLSSRKMKK